VAPAKRGGALVPLEGSRWLVTLAGRLGEHAPSDLSGFLSYAQSLRSPLIYRAIRDAKPCSEPVRFRFPTGVLRHYERLARFPERLLPLGDAICSLNPLYGQGMSIAALQARALADLLAERKRSGHGLDGLWRDFLPGAARILRGPWSLACGQNFQYEATRGRRPPLFGLRTGLMRRVVRLTQTDSDAAVQFARVIQMLDPPHKLLRPKLVARAVFRRS
jgi:2-polyprenyl-6-methoxyphenol hydroxylase-like FAD-dependent oxidoreductase